MSGTSTPSIELKSAFELFNQASGQLTHSFALLEEEVQRLRKDLTQSKSQQLQQQSDIEQILQFQKSVFNALGAAIIVIDVTGHIMEHNTEAAQLLPGIDIGLQWSQFIAQNIRSGESNVRYVKNKHNQWLDVDTRPLKQAPGQVILIRNVTEQFEIETRIRRMQRLSEMGEMLSRIAHQIRTPLSTALLYVSQLKAMPQQSIARSHAQSIYECLHHMSQLISDMLMFSKGEQLDVSPIEFGQIMRELKTTLHTRVRKRFNFHCREETGQQRILANSKALTSALENLITNALEASQEHQLVDIECSHDDQVLRILIKDQGCGMSPQVLERVFDPFFTTKQDGTGLGMAVVRAVVEAHAGTIHIESDVDMGTTVMIELPVVKVGVAKVNTDALEFAGVQGDE